MATRLNGKPPTQADYRRGWIVLGVLVVMTAFGIYLAATPELIQLYR